MYSKRIERKNTSLVYFIAFAIILSAFLMMGGASWFKDLAETISSDLADLNWL